MKRTSQFGNGVLAGGLLMLAANGGHWLITPARHPDSTPAEYWFTVVGMVICIAVAVVLIRKHIRAQRASSGSDE